MSQGGADSGKPRTITVWGHFYKATGKHVYIEYWDGVKSPVLFVRKEDAERLALNDERVGKVTLSVV